MDKKFNFERGGDMEEHSNVLTSKERNRVKYLDELAHRSGATPLHDAVANRLVDSARILIENGSDINARDSKSRTVVHYAAILADDKMLNMLAAKGADINAVDCYGNDALYIAIICSE